MCTHLVVFFICYFFYAHGGLRDPHVLTRSSPPRRSSDPPPAAAPKRGQGRVSATKAWRAQVSSTKRSVRREATQSRPAPDGPPHDDSSDRKSTRLNSSH